MFLPKRVWSILAQRSVEGKQRVEEIVRKISGKRIFGRGVRVGKRQRKKNYKCGAELQSAWTDLNFSAAEWDSNSKAQAEHPVRLRPALKRRKLLFVCARELRRLPIGR
jgi:hypothetical protein